MKDTPAATLSIRKLAEAKAKPLSLSQDDLIRKGQLGHGNSLPLVVKPALKDTNLLDWATNNRPLIESELPRHGGILFRGFNLRAVSEFEQFIKATSEQWAVYREAATPRSQVSGNIFTSTEYPSDHRIFLHNENSHCDSWPMRIYFYCITPAQEGGETPIADCRKVFERIDPDIRERLIARKIMYVRNFGEGLGFSWQTVFQANDKNEVEQYCKENGIEAVWGDGDRLQVRYVRRAALKHPRTGEMVWFNHGTFFHVSTLEPAVRKALLATLNEERLPYNTYYGDGEPIEPPALDALREAYRRETVSFPWQAGDVLMLDNMLVAHGRMPFTGPRKVLVGMADPVCSSDIK